MASPGDFKRYITLEYKNDLAIPVQFCRQKPHARVLTARTDAFLRFFFTSSILLHDVKKKK